MTTATLRKQLKIALRPRRWSEYSVCLDAAVRAGYRIVPVEIWLQDSTRDERTLVLRHDVDVCPRAALEISRLETERELASTFYFRWSTLDRDVVERVRDNGSAVGLHYETLTRYAIENGLRRPDEVTADVVGRCRETLKEEIERFRELAGPCDSVAAHGDPRANAIGCTNDSLLRDQDYDAFGIRYSADDRAALGRVGKWVSDGTGGAYRTGGVFVRNALAESHGLIVWNSHPNHWERGFSVLVGRVAGHARALPRHPSRWRWGVPDALAWDRYREGIVHG